MRLRASAFIMVGPVGGKPAAGCGLLASKAAEGSSSASCRTQQSNSVSFAASASSSAHSVLKASSAHGQWPTSATCPCPRQLANENFTRIQSALSVCNHSCRLHFEEVSSQQSDPGCSRVHAICLLGTKSMSRSMRLGQGSYCKSSAQTHVKYLLACD